MKVCIDPGHGGKDSGATGNGFLEKDLTLELSLKLRNLLEENDVDVVMTRESDVTLDPDPRIIRVQESSADLCVSIHFNASNGSARGAEVIYQMENANSQRVAQLILDELAELGIPKRKTYSKASNVNPEVDYYFMLRRTRPIDAVIVESLFIDNSTDMEILKKADGFDELASAIGRGILEYFNSDKYNEGPDAQWAKEDFEKLKELGIVEDTHNLNDHPTWGELSAVLSRMVQMIEKK